MTLSDKPGHKKLRKKRPAIPEITAQPLARQHVGRGPRDVYILSESYFSCRTGYPASEETSEQLVKKYPNTRTAHETGRSTPFRVRADARVETPANGPRFACHAQLGCQRSASVRQVRSRHAATLDEILRFDDPTGKLADDADMAAGHGAGRNRRTSRGQTSCLPICDAFPDEPNSIRACLGLQTQVEKIIWESRSNGLRAHGQKPNKLIKQIHRQFPKEAQEHREFLAKSWQEVRLKEAEHDWQVARYHHKRKEHGGARQYYERVRDEFGDTSLAKEATEKLAEIADEPSKPEQALPWVARLFPTPDREKPLVARNPFEKVTR